MMTMSDNLIEQRGIFWLASTNLTSNQFAPDNAVHGTFKVKRDGSSEVELDWLFEHRRDKGATWDYQCQIAGLLNDNRYVFLADAQNYGLKYRSSNLDTENFRSTLCLCSDSHIEIIKHLLDTAASAIFPLGQFQDWVNLYPIEVVRENGVINVSSPAQIEKTYKCNDFDLTMRHFVSGLWPRRATEDELLLRLQSTLVLDFKKAVSIDHVALMHRRMQELLILLSNREPSLEWPIIQGVDKSQSASLYYWRTGNFSKDLEPNDAWIRYSDIESNFGSIIETWLHASETVGPGYYLYLSTRRGLSHYSESKFISLVSGIEALHRYREKQTNLPVSSKINVIHEFIRDAEGLKPSHKRWLLGKLKHAGEPSLSDRIYSVISDLPVKIDHKFLRRFAGECQKIRNSIAHFGRVDRYNEGPAVYDKLNALTAICDHLYHIRILQDIGVPEDILISLKENARKNVSLNFYVNRCLQIFAAEDALRPHDSR